MIYKAIPGPKVVGIKDGHYSDATNLFADIMNAQAAEGWTYHSMETISTQAQVGCFFNKRIVTNTIYMLIFCKEA